MALHQILIVEDEAIVAKDIELRLEDLGYKIVGIASSGEKALRILESTSADLILMDINLRGHIDGIETAQQIRIKYDIPIVFLTAYADDPTFERAKLSDPFGYILKPFEERVLQINIEIAFHKYQSEKKIKAREKWIESVLNSINSSVIATDINGKITYVNPSAALCLDIEQQELLGQSVTDMIQFYDEPNNPMMTHPVELVLRKGTPQLFDYINIKVNDNPSKTVQISIGELRDHTHQLTGAVLGFRDISKRRQSERELRLAKDNIGEKIEANSKSLQKKLSQTELQLQLNHRTIKELRKIERRYQRLTGSVISDDE